MIFFFQLSLLMAGNLKNVLELEWIFCSKMMDEKGFGDIFVLFSTNSGRFKEEVT